MPKKTIAVELEGFIGGIADKKWYQERGCKIWDQWANPKVVDVIEDAMEVAGEGGFDRKDCQRDVTDLGPIYGYQWRRFNWPYSNSNPISEKIMPNEYEYDQLNTIVKTLHNNPNDRRMVCSAWNPLQIKQMALPPCHHTWELTHIDGILNLHWDQRSCDLMLGVPFNIASYAMLLDLLAKEGGLIAGNLSGMLCDCHIYENQLDAAREQVTRIPLPLPQFNITNFTSIFDWTHQDFELEDYNNLGKINFGEVAV